MKIFIINGPNLNLLGIREPEIYGKETYQTLQNNIEQWANNLNVEVNVFQSNIEGEIVNFIQKAYFEKADGIIINPAAYTHTSIAILDAIKAVKIPTIEIHISNINGREDFRKKSLISESCVQTIAGLGTNGYKIALENMKSLLEAQYGNKR